MTGIFVGLIIYLNDELALEPDLLADYSFLELLRGSNFICLGSPVIICTDLMARGDWMESCGADISMLSCLLKLAAREAFCSYPFDWAAAGKL